MSAAGQPAGSPPARDLWAQAQPPGQVRYNLSQLGITEEEFNRMLEAQGYACGMCGRAFEEGEHVHIDHDHTCCPRPRKAKRAKTCGKCIRGLLCFRCNTALGYIEMYADLAKAYLGQVAAA